MKKTLLFVVLILITAGAVAVAIVVPQSSKQAPIAAVDTKQNTYPLAITAMKKRNYPGSQLTVEQMLPDGTNYHQYIVSYFSDGLKIYALLTVPVGQKPLHGWPVIVFNHGYIAPTTYQTFPSVGQYATYVPPLAQSGYIVLKPDYRGNGKSEGQPEGAYYSPAYTVDVLNALASIKKYPDADPTRIGMWGHSMGGNITLRSLVVDQKDIKAAVIWGGVVGSYTDLEHWHDPSYHPSAYELSLRYRFRATLEKEYGTPETNPTFWHSVDPTFFLPTITTPLQLHVGTADEEVPPVWSENIFNTLHSQGKVVQFFSYPGANHNISQGFIQAMDRSIAFFNTYLKGGE